MHYHVVGKEVAEVNAIDESRQQKVKRQRDEIRRIKPADSSFPESPKANLRLLSRCARSNPLKMNAETRDYKKQEDTNVSN
jgi:hypothetical protein